jgi:PleD family two-component response regulator
MRIRAGEVKIDASIGVALALPTDDVPSLIHRADVASYRAKSAGRGRIELAD